MSEPTTAAGRDHILIFHPEGLRSVQDVLAIEAEASQQERALDVERLARAYLDHVATAAVWPTPNARPSWVDGHRPGFGCDGQCEKANALRAALAPEDKP